MMKHITKLIILLLISLSFVSCKKELAEANINPNNPENVSPEYLLNTSVFNTINLFGGDMRRQVFSHYSNYVSVGGGQLPRYFTFASTINSYWQDAYVDCLQPLHQIELNYGEETAYKNRVAIAKIFECYIYSNIVAIWGSVPKTYALSGNIDIPYDKEEDIYNALFTDLKKAADAITLNGDTYSSSSDAVYKGDLLKWKKFANTLRLRLAIRISKVSATKAKTVAQEVLADETNTIRNLSETASAFWGTNSNEWSYLYEYNVIGANANASSLNVVSESLVQHMLPYGDPRLPIYAKPAAQGPYQGQYWGQPKATQLPRGVSMAFNPHSSLGPKDYSMLGDLFTKPNAEYVFLSYEEACFLKSEAALNGWGGSQSAEQYYNTGITASMQKYNIAQTAITNYLNKPGIKWNTIVDTTGRQIEFEDFLGITSSAITQASPFKQIVMQTWLAGFYQALDAWTLIRRSQVLEFPPHFNPDGNEGGAVGYANIPQRVVYPPVEYQVNSKEITKALQWLGGPDEFRTKLWFALPTNQNPFLPPWQ